MLLKEAFHLLSFFLFGSSIHAGTSKKLLENSAIARVSYTWPLGEKDFLLQRFSNYSIIISKDRLGLGSEKSESGGFKKRYFKRTVLPYISPP